MIPTSTNRPNVLLLHTDQQRFDTIAALGAAHMDTPNIDRIVKRGTSFVRAYSSNPVCQPARHDLLTCASARHHGYYINRDGPITDYGVATVPRLLTEAGYQTYAVGKMHFYPQREHHGFAHMYLMEELPSCREDDAYLQYLDAQGYGAIRCQHGVRPLFYHTPQPARVPEEHHGSAWVATKTIELLQRDRDRPFFLFASWVGPHPPYYVPQKYLDLYSGRSIPSPCPSTEESRRQAPASPENPEPGGLRMRLIRESYYAAVTLIDQHIGRILDVLEETGLAANTIVLFTSDHGEMLGDLGAYQKHIPYEGSARIPLIGCGPGFPEGERCAVPVTTWDTAATILEATGVTVPESHPLIGTSLRDLVGRKGRQRTVVYHHALGESRYVASTDGRYKFIHWYNDGQEELYNLDGDPWEQHNLAKRSPEVCRTLRGACLDFERQHGVAENVNGEAFVDHGYRVPPADMCSLYPPWSSFQFPPWPAGYSREDLSLIAGEMNDCLRSDGAYICRESSWRNSAVQEWESIGGEASVYQALFEAVDSRER